MELERLENMILFVSSLATLLIGASALFMNYLSIWSFASLDQSAMDASLISLCLQSKNYIESHLQKTNVEIEAHQDLMSSAVAICQIEAHGLGIAAAASAGGLPMGLGAYERAYDSRMKICNYVDILSLEIRGRQLMLSQYNELLEFKTSEHQRWTKLFKLNHLNTFWIHEQNIRFSSRWPKAWRRRSRIPSRHIKSQAIMARYGPDRKWPIGLEANSSLTQASRLEFSYQPEVKLLDKNLKAISVGSLQGSSAYLKSGCQLGLYTSTKFYVQALMI